MKKGAVSILDDLQAWNVARVHGFKSQETPWPRRKGDSTTTYNSQYNQKEFPHSRILAYPELRSKTLDKNDYGTQGASSYKVRFRLQSRASSGEHCILLFIL
jgi:hypothetical protein